jgi:hypothetical protein
MPIFLAAASTAASWASVVTGRGPMDRMEGARAAVDGLRDLGVIPKRAGAAR